MSAWSHLPNAAHIDRIIESLKSHPEVWGTAYNTAYDATQNSDRNAARDAAYDAASAAARISAWSEARDAARTAAYSASDTAVWSAEYDASRTAVWRETRDAARTAVRDAILTLVADDDAAKYLEMSSDQLKMLAILSEIPSAVLLLSAVIAFEQISVMEHFRVEE